MSQMVRGPQYCIWFTNYTNWINGSVDGWFCGILELLFKSLISGFTLLQYFLFKIPESCGLLDIIRMSYILFQSFSRLFTHSFLF